MRTNERVSMMVIRMLYGQTEIAMRNHAMRLLGDPYEAEAVTEDVFRRLLEEKELDGPEDQGFRVMLRDAVERRCEERLRELAGFEAPAAARWEGTETDLDDEEQEDEDDEEVDE